MSNFRTNPWTGNQVWSDKTFTRNGDWMVELNEQEIREIYRTVKASVQSGKPIGRLTRDDFAFKDFGERLLSLKEDILNGKGFTLLHGLPANEWSDEELVRAYWGIGTWIGDPVSQIR